MYKGVVKHAFSLASAAGFAIASAPVAAQAVSFLLINNTDIEFSEVKVRRFGTEPWIPLVVAPVPVAKSGGRGSVRFSDPDCSFDLQARLPDGRMMVWPAVNLCDATVVTLNRNANGELWADYR